MMNDDKDVRILDAVFHEAALIEADEGPVTLELRRDVDAIMAYTRQRLAELRRAEIRRATAERSITAAAPARPSIVVMTRDAILARLAALCTNHRGAVFAHRDFAEMTDEDLRTALEDAESLAEQRS
jgi:hypothetical protein